MTDSAPPHLAALLLVMAADSFTLMLKAEKNFCGDNAQIERSLLPAFHRVKRACIGGRPLSAAWHIAEVDLNQRLLSGVSPWKPAETAAILLEGRVPGDYPLTRTDPDAGAAKKTETALTVGPLAVIEFPSPGHVRGRLPRAQVIGAVAQGSSGTPRAIVEAWERLGEGRARWRI